jgi:hypothetical protein
MPMVTSLREGRGLVSTCLMPRAGPSLCLLLAVLAVALASCQRSTPPADAPKAPASPPAEVAPAAPAPTSSPPVLPAPALAMPAADPPPGPLYFCDVGGTRAPLELDTRVDQLCRRHPQMGPCQYERDACRARGGRVFTARDEEITPAVEAEYDRLVRRVRFQADGGAPAR